MLELDDARTDEERSSHEADAGRDEDRRPECDDQDRQAGTEDSEGVAVESHGQCVDQKTVRAQREGRRPVTEREADPSACEARTDGVDGKNEEKEP